MAIARRAKPLERLKQRYKAFQLRRDSSTMALPVIPTPSEPLASGSGGGRVTLGTLGGGLAAGALPSSVRPVNGKKSGLSIFVEGTENPEGEDANGFRGDLQTREVARKENEREAVGWKGETLPQGRGLAPRTPKIEIFRDDVRSCAESLMDDLTDL